jgi:hypothetical protein
MTAIYRSDKIGFWPEIAANKYSENGCPCWRCYSDCSIEIPHHIMGPIWSAEWDRIKHKHNYYQREEGWWPDLATEDKEDDMITYDEQDFKHLMVYNIQAGCKVLTINPEMGMEHVHVQLKETANDQKEYLLYTGYFQCLANLDNEGNEKQELDKFAIETIKIECVKGKETKVNTLINNPDKLPKHENSFNLSTVKGTETKVQALSKNSDKRPKCKNNIKPSMTNLKTAGHLLFNQTISKNKVPYTQTMQDHFNIGPHRTMPYRPHQAQPANTLRTVQRVRHPNIKRAIVHYIERDSPHSKRFKRAHKACNPTNNPYPVPTSPIQDASGSRDKSKANQTKATLRWIIKTQAQSRYLQDTCTKHKNRMKAKGKPPFDQRMRFVQEDEDRTSKNEDKEQAQHSYSKYIQKRHYSTSCRTPRPTLAMTNHIQGHTLPPLNQRSSYSSLQKKENQIRKPQSGTRRPCDH